MHQAYRLRPFQGLLRSGYNEYSKWFCKVYPCYSHILIQPYYIAPEVFQQNYTSKIDLWSMGVVLYILLSGKVPFPGRNELEIISNVVKGEFHFNHDAFKTVSDDCKDLICHLLVKDVNKRYSAEEAYNHRWI